MFFFTPILITCIKGGTPAQIFLEKGSAMTRAAFVIFLPKLLSVMTDVVFIPRYTGSWEPLVFKSLPLPIFSCWYRPVQKPCIDRYYWSIHGYLFVYVLINYNVTYNLIFSSPGPKVQVNYCHHLASVVCRLSSVNFSHFKLLLRNHLADLNRT